MRGEEFLRQMELADPEYVAAADAAKGRGKRAWIGWGTLAACLCAAIIGAAYLPRLQPAPPAPDPGQNDIIRPSSGPLQEHSLDIKKNIQLDEPREAGAIVFNEADTAMDASRQYIPGYFTQQLSEDDFDVLLPDRQTSDMAFSGYVGFDGEGTPLEALINVTAPFLNGAAVMRIAKDWPLGYYELSEEPVVCTYNGVDITAYLWRMDEVQASLTACFEMNGYSIVIGYDTTADALPQAKTDFEELLNFMTSYGQGTPDLQTIVPETIPEFFDRKLTFEEARLDGDFGAWMPNEVPTGFAEESIRRYKDQNRNELSGLWTKGYDELSWRICFSNEEALSRLTNTADTENYDLSLYPIPRAQSVPEELRQIVHDPIFHAEELTLETVMARAYKSGEAGDSTGWRLNFGVKYGDIIVEIRGKGVNPEWIYRQLSRLTEE